MGKKKHPSQETKSKTRVRVHSGELKEKPNKLLIHVQRRRNGELGGGLACNNEY